ncbi:MAG: peptide chain release factor N(5)-glutamine methyltransferase [Bacteroidales bacterium]|nr:peptide chain release factor N(5)-glutamine methyltransferase [Bacteroidales bacterium]
MLIKDLIRRGVKALGELYPEAEARSLVLMLCQERLGVMSWTHVVEPGTVVPDDELPGLQDDLARLAAGEPIQYILGYTEFRGRIFKTDPRALIPRIETELLVEEVVSRRGGGSTSPFGSSAEPHPTTKGGPPASVPRVARPSGASAAATLQVLDLCTGSGCIAWSLAYELPGAVVTGADISEDALALARSQFRRLPKGVVRPTFMKGDILDFDTPFPQCDILTANPPYITLPEKKFMRPNVLDWEPEVALFAPESDPLAFHKAIAVWARRLLRQGGFGIVEINEDLGPESLAVFKSFRNVRLVEDFAGKSRFVAFENLEGQS